MKSTIPAEVLALKARIDQWRATRNYIRERMPDHLREAVAKLARKYQPALIRRALNVDPWRLNGSMAGKPAPTPKETTTDFFQLPIEVRAPTPSSIDAAAFRLQLERPDGARLTLTLPALDLGSVRQFCVDFLRDDQP